MSTDRATPPLPEDLEQLDQVLDEEVRSSAAVDALCLAIGARLTRLAARLAHRGGEHALEVVILRTAMMQRRRSHQLSRLAEDVARG